MTEPQQPSQELWQAIRQLQERLDRLEKAMSVPSAVKPAEAAPPQANVPPPTTVTPMPQPAIKAATPNERMSQLITAVTG
jgi:hypothetical protein